MPVKTNVDTQGGFDNGLPVDKVIDITADVCPMTFVRTRLALDRLSPGQVLCVLLRGEEPRRNVPSTARDLGHEILAEQDLQGGTARIWIRRGPDMPR